MEPLEEHLPEEDIQEEFERGLFEIQKVNPAVLQDLGQKMNKRLGVNVIQSAQLRETSDFIFDLESALITIDTTQRKTYTVPFLEKDDRYSTFNLVVVTDSLDNLLDQYILQYGFDSLQYSTFLASGDFLESGVEIKRFSFSSFFNDSNPLSLERCQGISDENGDPVVCDQVTIDSGSSTTGGGGSSGGGTAWITPGGGGGGSGVTCSWIVYIIPCNCHPHHTTQACGCPDGKPRIAMQITCKSPHMRNSYASQGQMTCMDCDISDFGSPAFTPTKISTAINRDLGGNLSDFHLWYLSENPAFAGELRQAFLSETAVDVEAGLFTLAAGMNGALEGDFNTNFGIAIEGLMTESTADFSDPAILRIFQHYFELNYAVLRQTNPGWSEERLFYETSKEAIHLALDGIGLIEGLGTPADLLNAGLYYLEGDRVNGNLSLVAATPGLGLLVTTSKGAIKLGFLIPGTTKRLTHTWKPLEDGIIEFSGTRLRQVINLTDKAYEAHHLIPFQLRTHDVVQLAARAEVPLHKNQFENGFKLLKELNGNHTNYNQRMLEILNDWKRTRRDPTPEQAKVFLEELMEEMRVLINNNPGVGMQNLEF